MNDPRHSLSAGPENSYQVSVGQADFENDCTISFLQQLTIIEITGSNMRHSP
jgi:hypothetical protein